MKRILIYKNITSNLETNINTHYNNNEIFDEFKKLYPNHMPNTGNKVWFQGIVSELSNQNSVISFLTDDMNIDYINNNFDLIVYPMANIFGYTYKTALDNIGATFEKIRIPTYIISCGIQAKSIDEIDDIVSVIKTEANRFISSVYNTGGQFALRGNITNSFFKKLGYNDAAVVGCPSLYQRGAQLRIDSTNKVSKDSFKAILNGSVSDYTAKSFFSDGKCSFIDQDCFVHPLFNKEFCSELNKDKKKIISALKYYGYNELEQVFKGNVQLFFETNLWYNYLIKNNFSFSFGSRIHGNIMSILSGIPTLINAKDVRVKEMAELYNIPYIENKEVESIDELYELYCKTDYTKFNQMYSKIYSDYEDFLIKNDIVDSVGITDSFTILNDDDYNQLIKYPTENQFYNSYLTIKKYSYIFKILNYIKH